MKTIVIVVLAIALTGALVFVVLPHYGIRTLPSKVAYFSEPEPETVEYVARPAVELGKQILSPWVSEQSKDSTWTATRGNWVLWKGNVHSIEPALNPSRIVLVHEYEAPLPYYTQRFGVVVEFDAQWSESLKQLIPGETVYFRAKLVDREFRLADVYRYGLHFDSYVLRLEHGQIIDENEIGARLADLAYLSYEQIDSLVLAAERIDKVMNYFARRANVSSDWLWQASAFVLKLVGIRLPHDPPVGDEYSEIQGVPLAEMRTEATAAKFQIEQKLAAALVLIHDPDMVPGFNPETLEARMQANTRIVAAIEDFAVEVEILEDEDRSRGELGIADFSLAGVGQLLKEITKLPVSHVISVVTGLQDLGQDIGYSSLYEQMIVISERQLYMTNVAIKHIRDATIDTISETARID